MKTYDSISMEVTFGRWYIDKDMGDKKDGYVRAKWNIILRCADRMMAVEFNTGFRDLIGPYNLTRIVHGESSFAMYSKTRKPITDTQTLIHVEKAVRAAIAGHNDWLNGLVKQITLKEPTKFDVMYCLCSDVQSLESSRNFEDWANDLGMDSDSRKAEKMYRATQDQTQQLRQLLNGANLEELCEFVRNIDQDGEEEARAEYARKEGKEVNIEVNIEEIELRVQSARDASDKLLQEAARAVLIACPRIGQAVCAMGSLCFWKGDKLISSENATYEDEKKVLTAFAQLQDKYLAMFGPTYGPWRITATTTETNW